MYAQIMLSVASGYKMAVNKQQWMHLISFHQLNVFTQYVYIVLRDTLKSLGKRANYPDSSKFQMRYNAFSNPTSM